MLYMACGVSSPVIWESQIVQVTDTWLLIVWLMVHGDTYGTNVTVSVSFRAKSVPSWYICDAPHTLALARGRGIRKATNGSETAQNHLEKASSYHKSLTNDAKLTNYAPEARHLA